MTTAEEREQKWQELYNMLQDAKTKLEQLRQSILQQATPEPVKTRGWELAHDLYCRDIVSFLNRDRAANAIDTSCAQAVADALARERREIAEMLARHGYTSIAADIAKRK